MSNKININWDELGFNYIKTDFRYISKWKDGQWDNGKLVKDNQLTISEGSTALHYGQECFEGLKAFKTKEDKIQIFRPDQNAKRLNSSCRRILMPEVPAEKFIDACMQVVKSNEAFCPPYGTGCSLYLRPFVFGIGDNVGLKPAYEYLFCVFCVPVGSYFKNGMKPLRYIVSEYDRAAPLGTGAVKVGGNYAASLYPHELAVKKGFSDCIYLDPLTHTKIEEVGAANFFGVTKENVFVTPNSLSILPSITKNSLLYVAKEYLKIKSEEKDVFINQLHEFSEAAACGTAAVITPIGGIEYKGIFHVFYSETEVGPITRKLYDTLCGIQIGDLDAPEGWTVKVK